MGYWTNPETIFFSGIASAGDAAAGYVTIQDISFNQDRIRIHALCGLSAQRGSRIVLAWKNHMINDNVPLMDDTVNANRNLIFVGHPYIEVSPCDAIVARVYAPVAGDDVYANCTLSRWIP